MAEASERQRRFAQAYLRTGDARRAARDAGYGPEYGRRALRTAGVRQLIERRGGEPQPRAEPLPAEDGRVASEREVLEFLTDVMRGELESEGRASAASPRMRAAELLGKRLGAFSESAEAPRVTVILDDIPPGEEKGDG